MKFGVELEFTASVSHARSGQYGNFYEYVLSLMRESAINNWRYEGDASCGNEIVSPVLSGKLGLKNVMQVCNCVNTAKEIYKISRLTGVDAGVHYHYDANDLLKGCDNNVMAIRNVLLLSAILEPLWFSMNPGIRFDTAFVAPLNFNLFQMIRARDIVDIRDIWFRPYMGVLGNRDSYRVRHDSYSPAFINGKKKPHKYDWTRYHGLNLLALWKHGTFEFRYTHGSFDPYNIEMWYYLYKNVIDVARNTKTRTLLKTLPVHINDIKAGSLSNLQTTMYLHLDLIINFMFKSPRQGMKPLFEPNGDLLLFILKKLIKYNPVCMPNKTKKIIWSQTKGDFEYLLDVISGIRMISNHAERNRYKWTPKSNIDNTNPVFDEIHEEDEAPY